MTRRRSTRRFYFGFNVRTMVSRMRPLDTFATFEKDLYALHGVSEADSGGGRGTKPFPVCHPIIIVYPP